MDAFQETDLRTVLYAGSPWWQQIGIGLAYGSLGAYLGWRLIRLRKMRQISTLYTRLFQSLDLRLPDILFLSFCAGFGEEVLFRAGVQPLLGLWVTSILFVAIHGYLNPTNWRIFVYGAFMTFVIAGVGWLFTSVGLISAIAAHFAIDVVLLLFLTRNQENPY